MEIIQKDPWLEPYAGALTQRRERFLSRQADIAATHKSLYHWANGHFYFGFHRGQGPQKQDIDSSQMVSGMWYREWAPGASSLSLIGDFNNWNPTSHPLVKKLAPDQSFGGVWEIFVPDEPFPEPSASHQSSYIGLRHGQKVKVEVTSPQGSEHRIPSYIRRVVQDEKTLDFAGQIWEPLQPFVWTDSSVPKRRSIDRPLRIYEAHIGMSSEKAEVATFKFFESQILPRVLELGYDALQLMAIMEHPYYGSFGYHVSNFFAVSSRFGTPEDLKSLINKAHHCGMKVFLDIVHSHAASNTREGLYGFDGSEHQYFHPGPRGYHHAWDSRLFDYGRPEVQHFLLSNIKFWLEEYHFDGFRFDGVTSMLYQHHGYGVAFDHYDRYFNESEIDKDAILYLQLANALIKEVRKDGVSIAEDVSGMPGLALAQEEGGLGFDYRLAMGLADYWVRMVTLVRDEDWSLEEIFKTLTNRRYHEKHIAYVESHDQSLVGDKTLIFRMADALMYEHMHQDHPHFEVERAIKLTKLIRLLTATAGGEGYLNFMGNEFGHPEWVDFPRDGNQWSYKYARRQWSLADNRDLLYRDLLDFDKQLMSLLESLPVLEGEELEHASIRHPWLIAIHEEQKILVYGRGSMIFIYNLHVFRDCYRYPLAKHHIPQLSPDASVVFTTDHVRFKIEPSTFVWEKTVDAYAFSLPHRSAMVVRC